MTARPATAPARSPAASPSNILAKMAVASRAGLHETANLGRPRSRAMRVDCDIHPGLEGTRTTLLPYLDDHWQEQVTSRGIDGLDLTSYPASMPLSCRPDWRPKQGKPGSNFELLRAQALDAFGSSYAICNVLYGAQAVFDPYMAAAFCRAINDWLAAEWLARDPRLRASIVVPMQAPDSRSRRSIGAPRTSVSWPCWCWCRVKPCSAAATTGPSTPRPSSIRCRLPSIRA